MIRIGDPMPVISNVTPHGDTSLAVTWAAGNREGQIDLVDLAPVIFTFKLYQPLRENARAFHDVRVSDDGAALEWAAGDIDMPATTIERLAEEQMTPADFKDFLIRNGLTYDSAAAQLGISRRLVAYYANNKKVPRYIALACAYLDLQNVNVSSGYDVIFDNALPRIRHVGLIKDALLRPFEGAVLGSSIMSEKTLAPHGASLPHSKVKPTRKER